MSTRISLSQGPPMTDGSCRFAPSVIAGSSFVPASPAFTSWYYRVLTCRRGERWDLPSSR